ncbi:tumor necrosis factor ligand superfamily member 15 [Pantherophis guttatus]|uniref:Tumor necrosis factor ligand superfamily member 15 n=1 Tax=Pantherophis guttatus TaxID=94885 RepID=A0A6P9CKW8_PANGU|nr:tumor necrosis factor ligand superfamily member 15 [Pantherophis guttatus]
MPFGELRSASGRSGGGGGCNRCGRCCKKREVEALRCLCGLGFLGMFLLALPVLYLIRAKAVEKAEEIPMERMPAAQKQHGNPLCNNSDATIRPSVHARVNSNISRSKCVNGNPVASNLLWDIQSKEGKFRLDEENVSFIIPKDGRYFVYTQVTFSCSRCHCGGNSCCGMKTRGPKNVWLEVKYETLEYSAPKPTVFLMSTSSIETQSHRCLYVAGVRLFKKDDKVMVNVSNPALVEPETHFTFFGAYFVG